MQVPGKAVWLDTMVVVLATLATAIVCVELDVSEALRRWTAPWERFQLDELPAVLLVLAVGLAWFAARRFGEAGRELRRRELAEAQLAAALTDNRRLSQQYVQLQEAERKHLARELHDELGQYLNVIKLDAVGLRDRQDAGGSRDREDPGAGHDREDAHALRERAAAIVANCDHIHAALTALIRQLRPVALDDLGLEAALEHCTDTWRSRLPGVRLGLTLEGDLSDLSEAVTLTVYRVFQEALNNIAKHAAARNVALQLERSESALNATIRDDGVGVNRDAPTRGLGLIGMRERVAALNGELEVSSTPGNGFVLTVRIPVTKKR
ncbi:MAG TPA: sensor histidine kinase [Steroidobacteraceae bacterium]|nr:sensor histidine kinase [Steroidobacteraceae bacterium]